MLEINCLKVSYGNDTIIQDFNLSLSRGVPLAVIGESGAGKTTLALSLLGLVSGQCSGEVIFKGKNLLTLQDEAWRSIRNKEISLVMQNVESALHPLYTALEQVAEGIWTHFGKKEKWIWERARQLLAQVGIKGLQNEFFPHQLSGGEKQRVLLAMALANNPELLILDEPTASLDALTKREVIQLLEKIAIDRMMLIVTHDLAMAANLARQIAVLYGGRIVETGPAKLLLTAPNHPYTRGLLRSYPNMTTTKDLQGIPGRMAWDIPGCPFHPRCTQSLPICQVMVPRLAPVGERWVACHQNGIIPLLKIKRVSKNFADRPVLHEVSLTLYEGETLALVGESGSGKSTLAKIIMGLIPADKGEVHLEGVNYPGSRRPAGFYRRVQMIFQQPGDAINHRMTVLQAVQEPLDVQGACSGEEKLERVKACLAEVELPTDRDFLARYPHELSGGELQRVVIARALILNPKLLIADEPTSALDASVQAKILKLFLNLQEKRGLAILFITHDLALARKVSDQMAVLQSGMLVEKGPTSQVTSDPRHPYTKSLLAAAPAFTCL